MFPNLFLNILFCRLCSFRVCSLSPSKLICHPLTNVHDGRPRAQSLTLWSQFLSSHNPPADFIAIWFGHELGLDFQCLSDLVSCNGRSPLVGGGGPPPLLVSHRRHQLLAEEVLHGVHRVAVALAARPCSVGPCPPPPGRSVPVRQRIRQRSRVVDQTYLRDDYIHPHGWPR